MPKLSKGAKSILEWVEVIVVSIVLALLINLFVIQPIKVDGRSMFPTLYHKDFVIISRLGRTFNLDVDYGDIVVVDNRVDEKRTLIDDLKDINIFSNNDKHNLWIKRVIGLPGDILDVRDGLLYINDELYEEPYLNEPYMNEPLMASGDTTYVVPEAHVFVMGDNRNDSIDSRYKGAIPMTNIKGVMAVDVSKLFR